MTHDRTQPPSNELMAKVMAKRKGFEIGQHARYGVLDNGNLMIDPVGSYMREYADPRTDTDAALELLHWLVNQSPYGRLDCVIAGWHLSMADESDTREHIPLSGQPFRTAVCWIAVDVLGVE